MRHWKRRLVEGAVACAIAALAASAQAGGGGQALPVVRRPTSKPTAKPPAEPSKKPESELFGQWEVTRVLPDLADQPHWGMRPNDPSVLYRSMTISADKIWFVGDTKSCEQPRWQALTTTWQGLFQKTGISRTPSNSAPARATPADYDLKVAGTQRAQAFLLCPSRAPSKSLHDAGWMALESPDSLVVRYSQQVLVTLRRRAKDEPPRASFACDKASTPVEKTLCGDAELAAWDRSVAEAMRQVLAYKDANEKPRVLREHMAWKAERDKCATDSACVRAALESRVTLLNQE